MSKKKYIGCWEAGSCFARPREFTNFREACRQMFDELTRKLRRGEIGGYWIEDGDGRTLRDVVTRRSDRTGGISFRPGADWADPWCRVSRCPRLGQIRGAVCREGLTVSSRGFER